MKRSVSPAPPGSIVGREREQARLYDLLDSARDGHGSLVLISGEAGIGKTTLVRDLTRKAGDLGALVLAGGCYDLIATPPYGPWSEALQHSPPEDGQPPVPAWFFDPSVVGQVSSQTELFEETRRYLRTIAEQQPLVIVLEDLHWADAASLEALRFLGRRLDETRILLVITYRDDEITRDHELYRLLPLLVRESQAQRLHLNRLDHDAIQEMLSGRYDLKRPDLDRLVNHVVERSEGNPFFAEEILHGLEDDEMLRPVDDGWILGHLDQARMPVLLQQALEFRLRHLSSATLDALQAAAVIGQIVPIDHWQQITELNGAAFEQAMTESLAARVLDETASAGILQFRHALIREALYRSLTLSQRRDWHRRAGGMLVEVPNTDPAAVAHHFLESGDPRTASWLIRAGVQAEGSHALRVAANHYDTAQALLETDPDAAQARGWLLFHTGFLLRFSDRSRGLAHLEDAQHLAQQVDDPLLAAIGQMQQGLLRCFEGDLGSGLADMERAHQIRDGVTSSQEQAALQAIRSLFPAESVSHPPVASDGIALFRTGNSVSIDMFTQAYVLWLAFAGRFNEATRVGEQLVDRVTAATEDPLLIQETCRDAYFGLATAADWLGRPNDARRWRSLALNAYKATGRKFLVRGTQYWELQHLLRYQADQLADRRRVTAAVIAANERAIGAVPGLPSRVCGLPLDLLEGRWDVARDLARVTLRDRQDPLIRDLRIRVFSVLRLEQVNEDFDAVVQAEINESIPDGPATQPGKTTFMYAIAGLQLAAHVALDRRELERARDWIEALDRWLDWSDAVIGRSEASRLWARYHHLTGDLDVALQHARRALEHASDPHQPLALMAAHRMLGQLATRTERYDEGFHHLQMSLALAERCEAPYEQALTMLEMAEFALRTDCPRKARQIVREARAICERLTADNSLMSVVQIENRLKKLVTNDPAGLSAREVEVLRLVAGGLTNAEVGEVLFISPRTVAQHLRSAYNKLGVNSRAAAVAHWLDLSSG